MINSEIDEFFKNGVNTEVVQYDDTVEIEKKLIYVSACGVYIKMSGKGL